MDQFCAQVRPRALRMACMMVRDRVVADDLVQDALIQLLRRYSKRHPDEWTPLFYRILRNRVIDWQRRRRFEKLFDVFFLKDSDEPVVEIPDQTTDLVPGPEEVLLKAELAQRISCAISSLPARQREAFLLREWENLSIKETALAMATTEGSVKTHHFRALCHLRATLAADQAAIDSSYKG